MMRNAMIKRTLFILVFAVLFLFGGQLRSEAAIVEGGPWNIGRDKEENVKATLSTEGVLTITGNGSYMKNWDNNSNSVAPWNQPTALGHSYAAIKTVIIGEGVFNIGKDAFTGCNELTMVEIRGEFKEINKEAISSNLSSNVVIKYSGSSTNVRDYLENFVLNINNRFPSSQRNLVVGFQNESTIKWNISKKEDDVINNVIAEFDVTDKTLRITGSGKMIDWNEKAYSPFSGYDFDKVIVERAVETVGKNAFSESELCDVYIMWNVTTLNEECGISSCCLYLRGDGSKAYQYFSSHSNQGLTWYNLSGNTTYNIGTCKCNMSVRAVFSNETLTIFKGDSDEKCEGHNEAIMKDFNNENNKVPWKAEEIHYIFVDERGREYRSIGF